MVVNLFPLIKLVDIYVIWKIRCGKQQHQCQLVLAKKAAYLCKDDKFRNVTINQALTNRMAKYRRELRIQLAEKRKEDTPGKKYLIRYGQIIQVNNAEPNPPSQVSKN